MSAIYRNFPGHSGLSSDASPLIVTSTATRHLSRKKAAAINSYLGSLTITPKDNNPLGIGIGLAMLNGDPNAAVTLAGTTPACACPGPTEAAD